MQTATATETDTIAALLQRDHGSLPLVSQACADEIETLWVDAADLQKVMATLKPRFPMLYDLFGIDERHRQHRKGQPDSAFTVVYHLLSFAENRDLRVKVACTENNPGVPTVSGIWPNANWYEREAWDMFGIDFAGHPHLCRILLPPTWEGHALQGTSCTRN